MVKAVLKDNLSSEVEVMLENLDGGINTEKITIRNVLQKDGLVTIDAYCHSIAAPRLIKSSDIIKIRNIATDRVYSGDNITQFLLGQIARKPLSYLPGDSDSIKVINYLLHELTVLCFIAKKDEYFDVNEEKEIMNYIYDTGSSYKLDEMFIKNYIYGLEPNESDFFKALDVIFNQNIDRDVQQFSKIFTNVIFSDGVIRQREQIYLAEFIEFSRKAGYKLKFNF